MVGSNFRAWLVVHLQERQGPWMPISMHRIGLSISPNACFHWLIAFFPSLLPLCSTPLGWLWDGWVLCSTPGSTACILGILRHVWRYFRSSVALHLAEMNSVALNWIHSTIINSIIKVWPFLCVASGILCLIVLWLLNYIYYYIIFLLIFQCNWSIVSWMSKLLISLVDMLEWHWNILL